MVANEYQHVTTLVDNAIKRLGQHNPRSRTYNVEITGESKSFVYWTRKDTERKARELIKSGKSISIYCGS